MYFPIVLVFSLVYLGTLSWIVSTWSTYQGSHGPVILAISLYMIYLQRESIKGMALSPNLPLGIGLTLTGCFLLISGKVSSVLLLQYLSLVVTLLGLVLLLAGTGYLKMLWYPIGYVIFMFPIFSELLATFSLHLQTIAAWIAHKILSAAGVAVFRQGHFLELPSVTLDVARECNGINHMMALVSLAIPLAYWTHKSWIKRVALIGVAFPIGILANGLRVSIIGLYAYYGPKGPVHGPYDLFYVSFIFFFGMFLLIVLNSVIAGRGIKKQKEAQSSLPAVSFSDKRPSQIVPIVGAVGILLMTWSYLFFFKPEPVYLAKPIEAFPTRVGDWIGRDVTFKDLPFSYFSADNELKRIYSDGRGHELKLYIGYFPSQEQGKEIIHYRFDPLQENARERSLETDGGVTNINVSEYDERSQRRSIYFWYEINRRVLTGRYAAKAATILDALLHRRTNAAIVVISTDKPDDETIKEFYLPIQNALKT
jgi:EpsI family protein